VARLAIDWRDVIVEAEYEPRDGHLVRLRNFNDPMPAPDPAAAREHG
jgi:hypothetical protein